MPGITYDTGALLAAEARNYDVWALHEDAMNREIEPVVPAMVLAQAWRDGPQPLMSRFLRGCRIEEGFSAQRARAVGNACALSGCSDIVDVTVVLGASGRGDLVITRDPGDLGKIADALRLRLPLHTV